MYNTRLLEPARVHFPYRSVHPFCGARGHDQQTHRPTSGVTRVLGGRRQSNEVRPHSGKAGARGLKVKCFAVEQLMCKQVDNNENMA